LDRLPVLAAATAALSNLVSNVPAVLVLRPLVSGERAWLTVAMASTLAGNLIVVEMARAAGVRIGLWAYVRVGLPLTVLTILAGLWWLAARSFSAKAASPIPPALPPGTSGI